MTLRNALSRREALTTLAVGGTALVAAAAPRVTASKDAGMSAAPAAGGSAFAGSHTPVPLPFAAGSLNGISEKLITSHHDNNYVSAVKSLNKVEQELSRTNAETPPFIVGGLREKELTYRNSKALHEAYFANLGGDGKRSGAIEAALAAGWGSVGTWESHFKATGAALGGGSGWVLLNYELDTGALRIIAATGHPQAQPMSAPLLVMDMYEHAYQMDYGAAAAKYIDAFFTNVKWDEVNRRLERAQKASASFRA